MPAKGLTKWANGRTFLLSRHQPHCRPETGCTGLPVSNSGSGQHFKESCGRGCWPRRALEAAHAEANQHRRYVLSWMLMEKLREQTHIALVVLHMNNDLNNGCTML